MKAKLEDRKQILESEFTKLESDRKELIEQGKIINQKVSEIQVRQVQLQGSYKEIDELLKNCLQEEAVLQ